jgi:hypothetical protein
MIPVHTEGPATSTVRLNTFGSVLDWTPPQAVDIDDLVKPLGLSGVYRLRFVVVTNQIDDVPSFTVRLTPAMTAIHVMQRAAEKIEARSMKRNAERGWRFSRDLTLDCFSFETLTVRARVITLGMSI